MYTTKSAILIPFCRADKGDLIELTLGSKLLSIAAIKINGVSALRMTGENAGTPVLMHHATLVRPLATRADVIHTLLSEL